MKSWLVVWLIVVAFATVMIKYTRVNSFESHCNYEFDIKYGYEGLERKMLCNRLTSSYWKPWRPDVEYKGDLYQWNSEIELYLNTEQRNSLK